MKHIYTEQDLAEQAGNAIADICLSAMLNAPNQAESVTALQTALLDLQRLPHPKRATAGFAIGLIAHLELGIGASL